MKKKADINLRFNALTAIIYIMGIILLIQLFNLQIINGETYRETSNTRLTRESTLYASRGYILDRNGAQLATTEMTFTLEMYKSKLENDVLNETILKMINTLEANGDSYIDTLPLKINPFQYNFTSEEKKANWLKAYKLDENTTPEEAFKFLKNKYSIQNEDVGEIRKILVVRYRITSEGYSSTKSLTISNDISRKSALIFGEQSDLYPRHKIYPKLKKNLSKWRTCITHTSDI